MKAATVFTGTTLIALAFCLPCSAEQAAEAPFYPLGAAQDAQGVVYAVDRNLPGVWKIENGEASVFFQGPKEFRQPLNAPRCIAIDREGRVLVGDSAARNVFIVTADQPPVAISQTSIGIPMALAIGPENQVYVADLERHQVVSLAAFAGEPVEPKALAAVRAPRGLAVDASGSVWVVTGTAQPIRTISAAGQVEVVVGEAKFKYPAGIAITSAGQVFVSDSYQKSISRIGDEAAVSEVVKGEPLVHPVALGIAGDKILIADSRGGAIRTVDADGNVETLYAAAK